MRSLTIRRSFRLTTIWSFNPLDTESGTMSRNVFGCESPESRMSVMARELEMTPLSGLTGESVAPGRCNRTSRELVKFKAWLVDARSRPGS